MDSTDRESAFFVGLISLLIIIFSFGIGIGFYKKGISDIRREAVKNNCAQWISDEGGNPQFEWRVK